LDHTLNTSHQDGVSQRPIELAIGLRDEGAWIKTRRAVLEGSVRLPADLTRDAS
jgi:hypothetical protein